MSLTFPVISPSTVKITGAPQALASETIYRSKDSMSQRIRPRGIANQGRRNCILESLDVNRNIVSSYRISKLAAQQSSAALPKPQESGNKAQDLEPQRDNSPR